MPNGNVTLDPLIRVIESLQDIIKRDRDRPRPITGANEDRTRTFLINPLLQALGWSDPLVLTTQYLVRYGLGKYEYRVPDYALHLPDDISNPIAFLEAKRMNEPLTSDHRKRLFEAAKYARNKGVEVQYCILTNGDRWDLYKPDKRSYLQVFSLLISEKSASKCAQTFHDRFPKPPTLETAESASRAEASASPPPNTSAPSSRSAIDVILSGMPATSIDLPKVLAYFTFCFTSSILIGWYTGYRFANPRSIRPADDLALFILYIFLCMFAIVLAARVVHLLFQYPKSKKETDVWRLIPLFTPIKGDRPITLYWVVIATVGGIGVGGLSGFFLGKLLAEFLDALGLLLLFAVPLTLFVLLVLLPSLLKRVFRNKQKAR